MVERGSPSHSSTHKGGLVSPERIKMPQVVVYTRTTCAPCKAVKMFLSRKGVQYRELNVDDDPGLMNEIIARSGFAQVPMTVIGDKVVSGQNFGAIAALLS